MQNPHILACNQCPGLSWNLKTLSNEPQSIEMLIFNFLLDIRYKARGKLDFYTFDRYSTVFIQIKFSSNG